MASKQELVQFLDQHEFDPILNTSPEAHKSNQEENTFKTARAPQVRKRQRRFQNV
jgi:hypothetical protein